MGDSDSLWNALDALSPRRTSLADGLSGLGASRPEPSILGSLGRPPVGNALQDCYPLSPPPDPYKAGLASYLWPSLPSTNALAPVRSEVKRKVYFAFDFDDLMRVNNVRQTGKVGDEARSFYDRSIWESRNIRDDDTLKKLMRGAVKYSSAVCVLIGTDTWRSRWVKYEIARAVVDERGLLGVHINGLKHIDRRTPDILGYNPLCVLGIYHSPNRNYYLYEKRAEIIDTQAGILGWVWRPYKDFNTPVPLPKYIPAISQGYVVPLDRGTLVYNYSADVGHSNIGAWIDHAAAIVGS